MSRIGFIGIGNMGAPMACNLNNAGHEVVAYDLLQENLDQIAARGVKIADSTAAAVAGADVLFTMLPGGSQVESVYLSHVFRVAKPGTLMIDCSTIDIESCRTVHDAAASYRFPMVDAPVSGGVSGATAGSLTFMAGGEQESVSSALPLLEILGKNIVHCGAPGTGQAAKICNNMMLGIQMASVAEAFVLSERLGLDAGKLFEVASTSSGQCWSLTSYCPVPGLVEASPANNNYEPGFASALMLKDMNLALEAAEIFGAKLKLAKLAASLYSSYFDTGVIGHRKMTHSGQNY